MSSERQNRAVVREIARDFPHTDDWNVRADGMVELLSCHGTVIKFITQEELTRYFNAVESVA